MQTIPAILAQELSVREEYVENVIRLLDEGSTIPFIARYRKELHGAMDDTALRTLEKRLQYLRNLAQRREEVKGAIEAQGKLTPELAAAIDEAATLAEVEDCYRPYRQKRRTRASIAKERGLEPLADAIIAQTRTMPAPLTLAEDYVNEALGVPTAQDALSGAGDILAERISDDAELRRRLRAYYQEQGALASEAEAPDETSVYRLYDAFSQPIRRLQSHQILALNRGEREGYLKVRVSVDRGEVLARIRRKLIVPGTPAMDFLKAVTEDSFDRLLAPSLERELRAELTDRANTQAIGNFALNLRPLLMQPPVRGAVTMGLDPGYTHGCKVAVVDETGKVLDTAVVYPTFGQRQREESARTLSRLIRKDGVRCIAIGNGTASRETEAFTAALLKEHPGVGYTIVNEAGASVYSASELAAQEFPQFDVNLRSAVSIARRLQDPLAELVKIDPKAIGVGQYQHDMPEKQLDQALDAVVEDCVNAVGVDLNTASPSLLRHVSGLSAATAKNIVAYREENGAFSSRSQLKKVPKLGPKAFEQCAGFLRVPESKNVLDNTAVHPESYAAASALLELTGHSKSEIGAGRLTELKQEVRAYGPEKAAAAIGVGVPTLNDLVSELMKPGRDIRDSLPKPILRTDVLSVSDLKPGMKLSGTVRNVIDFGAFVDIGVHQDGLVHISEISDSFLRHPSQVLSVGDVVEVVVLGVDEKKKRISLSIKQAKETRS